MLPARCSTLPWKNIESSTARYTFFEGKTGRPPGSSHRGAPGRVLVGGAVADKPARLVAAAERLLLVGPPPRFVGRGGEKLEGALTRFEPVVAGTRWLDAGASTGGFTDCLLQRGATEVVAV